MTVRNAKNEIAGYRNLTIVQNENYFKYSTDSILLAEFVNLKLSTKKILEIGCGNGPILLILSTKTNAKLYGVEIQKEIFDLATESVSLNKKESQIEIINDDINNYYKKCESDTFDIIVSNPPYFKVNKNSILNQNDVKTNARHEILLNIDDVIKVSKKLLKNNGSLVIVYKSDRIIELIKKMEFYNFSIKRIQFVYSKLDSDSNLVLIDATKNGKDSVKILPPIFLENNNKTL